MAELSRRRFVLASGATTAAAVLAGCSSGDDDDGRAASGGQGAAATGSTDAAPGADFDPADWASVREQFALDPELRHFAAFVFASHPRPVREAIARHRDGLDADPDGYIVATEIDAETAAREAAAEYLGAEADQVALTDSTTMGLGLVYGGLRLAAGDEVLTTEHDFYSTHEALRLRAERDGIVVNRVGLYDDPAGADAGQIVERLTAGVTPATRAVAVTWVHSGTGVKLPIADIAAALADLGERQGDPILLCVDSVHALGNQDVDVADLGCDFLISGTHKWLHGPRGTGVVWATDEAWARVDAAIPPFEPAGFTAWVSGGAPSGAAPGLRASPGGYHSFEHRWALAEAFRFHLDIGRADVAGRVAELATRLKEGLAGVDGVTVVTPASPELSAGIVCATVDGVEPPEVVGRLRQEAGIAASVTPYAEPYPRFGPGIVTGPEDVDALVDAVAAL